MYKDEVLSDFFSEEKNGKYDDSLSCEEQVLMKVLNALQKSKVTLAVA
jgi:hypothetical protein